MSTLCFDKKQKNVINITTLKASSNHHSQEMIITTLMSAEAKSFQCQKKSRRVRLTENNISFSDDISDLYIYQFYID